MLLGEGAVAMAGQGCAGSREGSAASARVHVLLNRCPPPPSRTRPVSAKRPSVGAGARLERPIDRPWESGNVERVTLAPQATPREGSVVTKDGVVRYEVEVAE